MVKDMVQVVCLDYNDVANPKHDLSSSIEEAFGKNDNSLGLLVVKNIPGYSDFRKKLLPLANEFANLPESIQEKYVSVNTNYNFGWSHGKEILKGKKDTAKGSFYANPQYDEPTIDQKLINEYPEFCSPNIWPLEEDCKDFEGAFKSLGRLIVHVGSLLSGHCDKYASQKLPSYENQRLTNIIEHSRTCKARLLHYFPQFEVQAESNNTDVSSWCGWHKDISCLTGLTSPMYLSQDGKEVPCPSENAGLYIRNRGGNIIKAEIPEGCLAFQLGECSEILSGGVLRSTPHCVKAADGPEAIGISRNTFAVFMQPHWAEVLVVPEGGASSESEFTSFSGKNFKQYSQDVIKVNYDIK